jgi:Uma2 family endonuclease
MERRSKSMPTPPATPKVTYEEYASWPDDGRRYEILDGEAVEVSSPGSDHQDVVPNLREQVKAFLRRNRAGRSFVAPLDVVLETHWIVQPDVLAVRRENLRIVGKKAVRGVPDLVAEVLSPNTEDRDRGIKRDLYERVGVRELWLVDVDARALWQFAREGTGFREVGVHRGDARFQSTAFPGMEIELGEVWPERQES